MLLYTKIIYNINSLLYNYISAPFLFYIFFARLLKFVEAFFFQNFVENQSCSPSPALNH